MKVKGKRALKCRAAFKALSSAIEALVCIDEAFSTYIATGDNRPREVAESARQLGACTTLRARRQLGVYKATAA